ncbi:MAG: thiamine pyrophosphate-dependent dehydrogenase E1 component subunit alpha [Ignavibacteriales bacterium]
MSVDSGSTPIQFHIEDVGAADLKGLLLTMLRIREFEERVADLATEKKIITPCHLYIGQEAVAVGVCHALSSDDYVFGTHRSHGHYLAKGGDMNEAMAEIFGRATGCSHGRGGSMHLVAPDVGILGTSSIVGGSMPIAVGAALAESIRGSGRVSVVFHGDAVPEEGVWHECANFAAVRRLPVVFVCENNLYSTHMPLAKRRVRDNIGELAQAHGLDAVEVDGNNVLDVLYAARRAVTRAREGWGPAYIECRTYRWRGHVGPNYDINKGLRSREELDAWMARCPIKHFTQFLLSTGVITGGEAREMVDQVASEVREAVEFAQASPYPDVHEVLHNVFRETTA